MSVNDYYYGMVAEAPPSLRAQFIRRTYGHLALAILAFVIIEFLLLSWSGSASLATLMLSGRYGWLVTLGAFMVVSTLADRWARSDTSPTTQYAGLALYVVAEAVIFVPLMYMATYYAGADVIPAAALMTALLFVGITLVAFITRGDFSFLGPVLAVGGMVALGVIVASILFGFTLGIVFSAIMMVFASAAILHKTSNIIHVYDPDQYVAASLALFASVALLLWYAIRLLSRR